MNYSDQKIAAFYLGPLDGETMLINKDANRFYTHIMTSILPGLKERLTNSGAVAVSEPVMIEYVEHRSLKGIFHLNEDLADFWNYHNDVFHRIREGRNELVKKIVAQLMHKEQCSQDDLINVTLVMNVHNQDRLRTVEHLFYQTVNLGVVITDLNMPRPGVRFIPHEEFRGQSKHVVDMGTYIDVTEEDKKRLFQGNWKTKSGPDKQLQ